MSATDDDFPDFKDPNFPLRLFTEMEVQGENLGPTIKEAIVSIFFVAFLSNQRQIVQDAIQAHPAGHVPGDP